MAGKRIVHKVNPHFDWRSVARYVLLSRAVDLIEEEELYPRRQIVYQFSSKGHELAQVLLAELLIEPHDAVSAYYRSRALLLRIGLSVDDALAGPLGASGGFSDGRDIGVVCNLPRRESGVCVLPMAGDVGSQYTPAAGWAQSVLYHGKQRGDDAYSRSIAVVLGGEGSVATNGFWSALTMATTLSLPLLFVVEDNGYAISVPGDIQTPGGNIAANLRSFKNLHVIDGDGVDPADAASCIYAGVQYVRLGRSPALVRLRVPRLAGHSGQDSQAYKPKSLIQEERERDPVVSLKRYLVPSTLSEEEWQYLESATKEEVAVGLLQAQSRVEQDPKDIERFAFLEYDLDGKPCYQKQGGRAGLALPESLSVPVEDGPRINMLEGIRRTLEFELANNPKLLVFGEDVGPKGGVHAVTMGLQEKFGKEQVFDTSLSEEGIVGRAVGMSFSGLLPVIEIQFRKYADPATEQLNNCGTTRWRTANNFASPLVVRTAGGFSKRAGDPWHSQCGEAIFLHQTGWQFAFPSNTTDAVGLLRTAMRSENPTLFFEHRALLDATEARRPYPGDDYFVPFGQAQLRAEGDSLSIVTWGAMVDRCLEAVESVEVAADVLDLRTLCPWDREAVMQSLRKTKRCLVVHEDTRICGFGGEIAAELMENCFFDLDAPIVRVCTPQIPIPYNVNLMNAVVPSVEKICAGIARVLSF